MAKIYKTTDIVPVNVDGLVVNISPLTFDQKMQVQAEMLKGGVHAAMRASKLACQYAIKSVAGIENLDGSDYQVELSEGKLSENCWDDLQNLEQSGKLVAMCLNLINGIPGEFIDPETREELKGVSIIKEVSKAKKK